eukprot:Rmarinus@m.16920
MVSWAGLLLASFVHSFTGYLWYSPSMFGKRWLREAYPGKKLEQMDNHDEPLKVAFASAFVSQVLLSFLLEKFGASELCDVFCGVFWMWLLVFVVDAPHYAFCGKGLVQFFIEQFHNLAALLLGGMTMFYMTS